jgi:O-phospho-L-seryl-tRNASec:L-selenocysteinyl-tRNA synthase
VLAIERCDNTKQTVNKYAHIQASREGRVDLVIQSTDKNLMVPVGGTLVVAFDDASIERVTKLYPGRASASQSLDLLITFLSMGSETYKQLLDDRKTCFEYLRDELRRLAERNGERLIETPGNTVSLAMSLKHLGHEPKQVTQIGSMLFHKLVSGTRLAHLFLLFLLLS